jgi:hypothetical protein
MALKKSTNNQMKNLRKCLLSSEYRNATSKYLKTSGFWPRVRARAQRAPVFLGSLPCQTGRCAPPPPIAASLLLIRPPKIFTIYRTWAAYVKGFFLSTKAMKYEVPCPRPAHRSFADPSGNIFAANLCFFLYFNCFLYYRHAN